MPRLYIGADHAGFELKEALKKSDQLGFVDLSESFKKDDDYPITAELVALAIQQDAKALGVLICGTGHGMEIAANRFKGVRAIVARTEKDAELAREHNHANILVLGGWITKPVLAKKILQTFLETKPSKQSRHIRRVNQLDA